MENNKKEESSDTNSINKIQKISFILAKINQKKEITLEENPHIFSKLINILNLNKNKNTSKSSEQLIIQIQVETSMDSLTLFLDIIINDFCYFKQKELTILECIHIINLSIFFLILKENLDKLLSNIIYPQINKDTSIQFINTFLEFLSDTKTNIYNEIINYAMIKSSDNLIYIINKGYFDELPNEIKEGIFEKYFSNELIKNKNIGYTNEDDNNIIIKALMKLKNIKNNDIYELVENEHQSSNDNFSKIINNGIKPSINWPISLNQNNFYKDSEPFSIANNLTNIILLSYYDIKDDIYSVGIRLNNENNSSNTCNNIILPLLFVCEIKEINYKSKSNFICIFSNAKNKILICKIKDFSKKFEDVPNCKKKNDPKTNKEWEYTFTLNIYYSVSFNFSFILSYLCRNFTKNNYNVQPSISKLSKNIFNIMLKYNDLTVNTEDDVVNAVIVWIKTKLYVTSQFILELIKNIKWDNVSIEKIIEFSMIQNRSIIESYEIRSILSKELENRFNNTYDIKTNTLITNSVDLNGNNNYNYNTTKRNYLNKNINNSNIEENNKFTSSGYSLYNSKSNLFEDLVISIAKVYDRETKKNNTFYNQNSSSNTNSTNNIRKETTSSCTNSSNNINNSNNNYYNFTVSTNSQRNNKNINSNSTSNNPNGTRNQMINNINNINGNININRISNTTITSNKINIKNIKNQYLMNKSNKRTLNSNIANSISNSNNNMISNANSITNTNTNTNTHNSNININHPHGSISPVVKNIFKQTISSPNKEKMQKCSPKKNIKFFVKEDYGQLKNVPKEPKSKSLASERNNDGKQNAKYPNFIKSINVNAGVIKSNSTGKTKHDPSIGMGNKKKVQNPGKEGAHASGNNNNKRTLKINTNIIAKYKNHNVNNNNSNNIVNNNLNSPNGSNCSGANIIRAKSVL